MAEMAFTIKIPALDRFCDLLERMEISVVRGVADKPAEQGAQEPPKKAQTQAPAPAPEQAAPKPQAAPEGQKGPQEPPKAEVEQVSTPEPKQAEAKPQEATAPKAPEVTMDALQRAAAQMRDEGKLQAVTGLFPEFGIRKLSDLKDDKLTEFAARLRAMGATI